MDQTREDMKVAPIKKMHITHIACDYCDDDTNLQSLQNFRISCF